MTPQTPQAALAEIADRGVIHKTPLQLRRMLAAAGYVIVNRDAVRHGVEAAFSLDGGLAVKDWTVDKITDAILTAVAAPAAEPEGEGA
jgi:hypothetical protein